MHMGEMTFKQRGEQAEADGTAEAEKVSFLLGVNSNDFIKCLVKPKIKVGTEVVTQGRTKEQVRLREEKDSKWCACFFILHHVNTFSWHLWLSSYFVAEMQKITEIYLNTYFERKNSILYLHTINL